MQAGALTDHLLPTMILKPKLPQTLQALPPPIFKPGQKASQPYIAIKPLRPQYLQQPPSVTAYSTPTGSDAAAADGTGAEDMQSGAADVSTHLRGQLSQQQAGVRQLHLYCITMASSGEQAQAGNSGELQRASVIYMKRLCLCT